MDWSRSYSSAWKVYKVNRDTWADGDLIDNLDAVSITRTADGSLLESGDLEATGEIDTGYYRIAMIATQGAEVTRVDVATLLFDVSGGNIDHGTTTPELSGYSVLYPAEKAAIIAGEYAPAGVDGAEYAGELLRGSINAPVMVEGSFRLNDHVVHEIGSSVLSAVWAVLDAGGFVIQIDGRGCVHIRKKPDTPVLVIDNKSAALLSNGIDYTLDKSEIPNRYIVVVGNNRTIAVNDDPESEVSTVRRGYNVDYVDESPTPVNGETIGAYAVRRLEEMSVVLDEREYTREYHPGVNLYDIVKASINGLDGEMRISEQSLECGYGITITETAAKEIKLWTRR